MSCVGKNPKVHQIPASPPQLQLSNTRASTRSYCLGPCPTLKYLQARGIHNLSGQLIPAPHYSVKNFLPTTNLNLPWFKTISSCPISIYPKKLIFITFISFL